MKKIALKITLILLLLLLIAIGFVYFLFLNKPFIEKKINAVLKKQNSKLHFSCNDIVCSFNSLKGKEAIIFLDKKILFKAEEITIKPDIFSFLTKRDDTLNVFINSYGGVSNFTIKSKSLEQFDKEANIDFHIDGIKIREIDFIKEEVKDILNSGELNSMGNLKIIDGSKIETAYFKLNIINSSLKKLPFINSLNFDIIKTDISLLKNDMSFKEGFVKGDFFDATFDGKIDLNKNNITKSNLNILCKLRMKEPFFKKAKQLTLTKQKEINFRIEGFLSKPVLNLQPF